MKQIAILGSTGSIGRNSLEVISQFSKDFQITYLSAQGSVDLLYEQAIKFRPRAVVLTNPKAAKELSVRLSSQKIPVWAGEDALCELVRQKDIDLVLNALVGGVGLRPTVEAIKNKKDIALANKETMVMAGTLIDQLLKGNGCQLYPIDSEHSAIWQCLVGEEKDFVRRLILTASGGPFRQKNKETFETITVEEALKHPNWNMGKKITIDSATLMNKGLEVIEARWLFDLPYEKIHVVIHPQSIIHSMVEFIDGSVKAQLGVPDMKIPIQYALTYPQRKPLNLPALDFSSISELTFAEPDLEKFPCLNLAFQVVKGNGTLPAVMNGANEVAVQYFLDGKIRFVDIPRIIEESLGRHREIDHPSLTQIFEADEWSRLEARRIAESTRIGSNSWAR